MKKACRRVKNEKDVMKRNLIAEDIIPSEWVRGDTMITTAEKLSV